MTDTNREASGGARRLAVRDLRFAGTVAAGLVAGVLGVGALSAPLLGWTNWPDSLKPGSENADPVRIPRAVGPATNGGTRDRSGRGDGGGERVRGVPRS